MIISITTIPASKKNIINKLSDNKFEVHLKAKAEHNQANQLLMLALAEYFKVELKQIKITSGFHSPHKRVEINPV